jgi:hypothetical protein
MTGVLLGASKYDECATPRAFRSSNRMCRLLIDCVSLVNHWVSRAHGATES